jgi:S1-C subfamily serine protease
VDHGVLIIKVVPGGPAENAGLRSTRRDSAGHIQLGDVILAIDGKPIESGKDLNSVLQQHNVGDTITLTILRDRDRQDVAVSLQGGSS